MSVVVVFFDPHSAFTEEATQQQLKEAIEHLKKTLQEIRIKNRKASLHVPCVNQWFIDPQNKLRSVVDREEWQFIRRFISRSPVARFVEYLERDGRVWHQDQASEALTAARRFKSGVVSFHQGVWVRDKLHAKHQGTSVEMLNFSTVPHVQQKSEIFTQSNIPVELLSYDSEVADPPFNSHGQKVYSNGRDYITPDVDEHKASRGWKKFDKQGQRLGTYTVNLDWVSD